MRTFNWMLENFLKGESPSVLMALVVFAIFALMGLSLALVALGATIAGGYVIVLIVLAVISIEDWLLGD